MKIQLFLFLVCLLYASSVEGVVKTGELVSDDKFRFFLRFCFKGDGSGQLSYTIKRYQVPAQENETGLAISFYYDGEEQWPAVYPTYKGTCESRRNIAVYFVHLNKVNPLCTTVQTYPDGSYDVLCTEKLQFAAILPRWWYLALTSCSGQQYAFDYYVEMTNGVGNFVRQFSADEIGILETSIAFFIFFLLLLMVFQFYHVRVLKEMGMYHSTIKLLWICIFLGFLGFLLQLAHYGKLSQDGIGSEGALRASRVMIAFLEDIFILNLLLLAHGLTVARGRLSSVYMVTIAIFIVVYVIVHEAVLIWEVSEFDPGRVLYRYESPPGYVLIAMRLLAYVWFLIAWAKTFKKYSQKRKFYLPFVVVYSFWLLAMPVIVAIAKFNLEPRYRMISVSIVESCVQLLGLVALVYLWRPNKANKHFPFHLRINQVGISLENVAYGTENGPPSPAFGESRENAYVARNVFGDGDDDSFPQSKVVTDVSKRFADLSQLRESV
eukprot:Colp12_sorted_trinity150504_noHs@2686